MERMSDEPMLRLLALRRAGLVSSKHPAVIDALTLLLFLRHKYFSFPRLHSMRMSWWLPIIGRWIGSLHVLGFIHVPLHEVALFRELVGILERAGVDSRMGDVSQRVEAYTQGTGGLFVEPQPPLGQIWLGQMQIAMIVPSGGVCGRALSRVWLDAG